MSLGVGFCFYFGLWFLVLHGTVDPDKGEYLCGGRGGVLPPRIGKSVSRAPLCGVLMKMKMMMIIEAVFP